MDVDSVKQQMAPLTEQVDETGLPEDLLCSYSSMVTDTLDSLAPMKRIVVTDRLKHVWYTPELAEALAALRNLEKKWCTSGLENDCQIFVQSRDAYYRRIDDAKCAHHRERIQGADDRRLFKIVDELIGKGCNAPSTGPSGIPAAQVPDKFGQFFADKVENFRSRFGLRRFVDDVSFSGCEFSEFQPVTEERVRKVVMESATKSCALDLIPTSLLKRCLDVFLPFITKLVNFSFRTGFIPESLKHAILTPLLKKPGLDVDVLNNYRPVCNTSFLMKTMERLACPQIHEHLSTNDLYTKCQSAYRANYSTETAILRVQNDICCALDRREYTVLVMLDLSAAFDTVDHQTLLQRLEHRFGITGLALLWFKSYLDSRKQAISFNGHSTGQSFDVKYGVPLGTVLGPLLFTLYSAPVADIITRHELDYMIYPDDTQMYVTCKATSEARTRIKACVNDIRDWMSENFLVLNDSKTELIVFESAFKGHKSTEDVIDSIPIGDSIVLYAEPRCCLRPELNDGRASEESV